MPHPEIRRRGIHELRPGVVGLRSILVWSYLLVEEDEVVAIDTGFGPHGGWIKRWFRAQGRSPSQLKAILLSHGHIDHVGCAAELQRWSNAPIYLHEADHALSQGQYAGPWPSRFLATVESMSNALWWTRKLRITNTLADGDVLPWCGGIDVIGLPGHTHGQVGFRSHRHRVLFAGDALIARGPKVFFPHRKFNLDDRLARTSIIRATDFEIDWVFPCHHQGISHNLMEDIHRYATARKAVDSPSAPTPGA